MPTHPDIVVIGGGVTGCSTLFHLADLGMKNALLLESGPLAGGFTGRSMAILRTHYSNEVTTRLAWDSLKVLERFNDVVGAPSGYVRTGYLLVAPAIHRKALEQNVAMQRRAGVDAHVLGSGDIDAVRDWFAIADGEACAYEPQSGFADSYLVTTGYANRAKELGAGVRAGVRVNAIEVKRGRVRSVQTTIGKISTDRVVVAAGPWSKPLLAPLKIDLPIGCVRHQVITLHRPAEALEEHPTIGDVPNGLSARPDAPGMTLVGVREDPVPSPEEYDHGVDWDVVEESSRLLTARMPRLAGAYYRGGWSGLFDVTPDWHPVLSGVEGVEGLYVAAGFSGHGFKLAPMVGKTMAELAMQTPTTIDVSMLGLGRFATGELMRSKYPLGVLA